MLIQIDKNMCDFISYIGNNCTSSRSRIDYIGEHIAINPVAINTISKDDEGNLYPHNNGYIRAYHIFINYDNDQFIKLVYNKKERRDHYYDRMISEWESALDC